MRGSVACLGGRATLPRIEQAHELKQRYGDQNRRRGGDPTRYCGIVPAGVSGSGPTRGGPHSFEEGARLQINPCGLAVGVDTTHVDLTISPNI
jgi:hypothetical protein